jgi:hypothetical protein
MFAHSQCCGSGNQDPVPFWPLDLDLGSGIGLFRIPDPGSWISDPGSQPHIFYSLVTNFLVKSSIYNSLKTGPIFFLQHFKTKIILNLVKFAATKKTNFFSPPLFCWGFWILYPGSWMGKKNQDPGYHPGSATLPTAYSPAGGCVRTRLYDNKKAWYSAFIFVPGP